jgi:carboxypeptidase C (cathepsin A)
LTQGSTINSDQPVGVGYSYAKAGPGYFNYATFWDVIGLPSEECPEYAKLHKTCGKWSLADATKTANSTLAAATNVWRALQGFMGVFPQYARHDFHFATESYGGVSSGKEGVVIL